MTEVKYVISLTLITVLIGLAAITAINYIPSLMEGDVVVEGYTATIFADGTLVEEYTYNVKISGKYRMLYRSWEAPLSNEKLDQPYIELLEAYSQEDIILYSKSFKGETKIIGKKANSDIYQTVDSLAELNEVGGYNTQRYSAGIYQISYTFKIHPPLEYDENLCHLNLKLASEHIPYKHVTIIIEDAEYVESVYPHPPSLKQVNAGDKIAYQGSVAKDELLEIELLLNKDVLDLLDGFPQRFDDVSAPTIKANKSYSLQYNMAVALKEGTRILLIAFPMLFLVLYSAYGREKSFVVPKYLSRIPYKERKPWIVNLVFKSDALDYDENGLYATILDLHRKGKIRMDTKKGGLTIKILDPESSDEYERRVLQFLQGLSKEGVVDKYDIKEQTKTLTSSASFEPRLRYLQGEMAYLTKNPDKSVAKEFMVNGRRKVVPFIVVSVILFLSSLISYSIFSNVASILRFSIVTSIILLIQSIIAIVFPSTLFGKWRGAAYKEKLEWDSFKRFLSDLALIKKYAPQDLSMWGQWLVFGTSLGVGKNVVKAMKKLKIPLEEANFAPAIPLLFRPIMVATLPSQSGARGGGGFGGGGFGAGGGFGGGGGGARFYRIYR